MYSNTGRPRALDIVSFKDRPVEILYCITKRSRWGTWNSISRINIKTILIEGSENAYRTALKTFRCRGGNSNGIFHSCIPRYYISMILWGCSTGRLYGWVGEPAVSIHMALSSNPPFSRAGRADTQTVWEPYRSCTDTLPLDYDRCAKEKIRKKWTE